MSVVEFDFVGGDFTEDNPEVSVQPIYKTLADTYVITNGPISIPLVNGHGYANLHEGVWIVTWADNVEKVVVPATMEILSYSSLERIDVTDADITTIQGITGPQGPVGPSGPMGPAGPTGAQGPQGVAGPTGPQGPVGPMGAQGPAGPTGATGATGPAGPAGPSSGLVVGTTAGTAAEGNDPRLVRWLDSGEESLDRLVVSSAAIPLTSQSLRLSFFTARKTEAISSLRVVSGTTAAGATPTLVRFGVYSVDGSGNLALVASTPNDTTLLAGASTPYTKALSAVFNKVAGTRYAVAVLVVTAATAPTVAGLLSTVAGELGRSPRICGVVTGQADLPANIVNANITDSTSDVYTALIP